MRYKVASKKNIDRLEGDNLLLELLALRGVENPVELLNLSPRVLCDATKFRGIKDALDLFHKHIKHQSRIHVIVD